MLLLLQRCQQHFSEIGSDWRTHCIGPETELDTANKMSNLPVSDGIFFIFAIPVGNALSQMKMHLANELFFVALRDPQFLTYSELASCFLLLQILNLSY
jgi:hypothetical protein